MPEPEEETAEPDDSKPKERDPKKPTASANDDGDLFADDDDEVTMTDSKPKPTAQVARKSGYDLTASSSARRIAHAAGRHCRGNQAGRRAR